MGLSGSQFHRNRLIDSSRVSQLLVVRSHRSGKARLEVLKRRTTLVQNLVVDVRPFECGVIELASRKGRAVKVAGKETEQPEFYDDYDDDDDSMPEDDSAFNQLCGMMNFPINDEELAGYMRDELFSGGNNLDNVKKRCFDNRVKQFYPDLQQMFDEEILEIWKSVTAEYNIFRDNPQGKIRKKALELLDVHMAWMRKLDANNITPDRVLEKKLIELMQIVGPVSGVVEFLNEEQKLSQKEVNNYCEMLDMAMTTHAGMLKKINKTLGM